MISDIIIAAVVILSIIIGAKRGLAKTLLNLASVIAAGMIARFLSGITADWLYTSFVKPAVVTNLEAISAQSGSAYAMENSFGALPEWVRGLLNFMAVLFGTTSADLQTGATVRAGASDAFLSLAEEPIGALVKTALTVVLIFLFFILAEFLLKHFVVRAAAKVFEIPVIKQINAFLGGIFGAAEGLVLAIILVNIFWLAALYMNPELLESEWVNGGLFRLLCFSIKG